MFVKSNFTDIFILYFKKTKNNPEMDTTNNTPGQDGSTATMLKTANSKLTGAAEKTTPSNVKLGTTGKLRTPSKYYCTCTCIHTCV